MAFNARDGLLEKKRNGTVETWSMLEGRSSTHPEKWRPGHRRTVPLLAFAAFFGAVAATLASVVILVKSSKVPINAWSIQPTVYLAIASSITNIFLRFILAEGATVTWWRTSADPGLKVSKLHRDWEYGQSLLSILRAGKNFNWLAFASLLVSVVPFNSALLQRSAHVGYEDISSNVTLHVVASTTVPHSFSGPMGYGYVASGVNFSFVPTLNGFERGAEVTVLPTGCKGTCRTRVIAPGFAVNCSSSNTLYHFNDTWEDGERSPDDSHSYPDNERGVDFFKVDFTFGGIVGNWIGLRTSYKESMQHPDCDETGYTTSRQCDLTAVPVSYPVVIDGNKSTITLDPSSSIFTDQTLSVPPSWTKSSLSLSGFYIAVASKYKSQATLRYTHVPFQWELTTTGTTLYRYQTSDGSDKGSSCDLSFSDPTEDILNDMRELAFRGAIEAADHPTTQWVPGIQIERVTVFKTNYGYMAAAVVTTILCLASLAPLFHRFWILGRHVSMSPLETAKAFDAPMLRGCDSNAPASVIVERVGDLNVKYGAVDWKHGQRVLVMGHKREVLAPMKGETFGG